MEQRPREPNQWPTNRPVTIGLLLGIVLGFIAQSELHANAYAYAKFAGVPKFLVQFAFVFAPLFLALPFAKLMRSRSVVVQATAAFTIGCFMAGYIGLALEFTAWFIGWN